VENHNLRSLRVLDSASESINPEAWNWYNEHVGKKQSVIVDTFWYVNSRSVCNCTQYRLQSKLRLDRLSSPHSLVRLRLGLGHDQLSLFGVGKGVDGDRIISEMLGSNIFAIAQEASASGWTNDYLKVITAKSLFCR
jgi:hypothetical protein